MSTLVRSVLVCQLLLASIASAQSPVQVPTDKKGDGEKYAQEASVLEQSLAKLVFENDGTFIREDSAKIRIQSQAGVARYQVLTFAYANSVQTLDVHFLRVRKPDGTVVNTPPENIQDMAAEITRAAPFYSDLREKHIAVKGLGTGDTLEFEIETRETKPLAPGRFWFSYSFLNQGISLHEELQIGVPLESAVNVASPRMKPAVSQTGNRRTYIWTHSNFEQKLKDSKEDQQLQRYHQARGRLPQPDVQISNFQSWAEVGRWYGDLQQERVKPSADIQAKAAQLIKDAPDENAKINAIYKYVSTEFHYIGIAFGIGRYQPHSASEVMGNQYGDCKDKHTLLASLLAVAGFEAYPALISTTNDVAENVPSPGQFNHVITAVARGKDILWLDSTPEVSPFGYLITPLRGKKALVIYGNKPAELVMTPPNPASPTSSSFLIKAKLDENGALEGQVERSTSGDDFEVLLRGAFRQMPFPQWKDLVQQISYATGFAGDVSEVTASSPEALDVPFHFSYKYLRKDYPDWPNRKIDPPLPPVALLPLEDDDKKLFAPVWLGAPGEHTYTAEVALPKGYRSQKTDPIEIKTDFADYSSSSETKGGKLITRRTLTIKLPEVPEKQFEEYKKFKKTIDDDHDSYVTLVEGNGANVTQSWDQILDKLPYSKNSAAADAYDEAKVAARQKNLPGAVSALERAVRIDPAFSRAWIWLGAIKIQMGHTETGLKALHTAIDIDPQQPAGYLGLGLGLLRLKRYEESIPVWQKFIALVPQDATGPASLGSMYFLLKRSNEAVTQLELAVKMMPDQPSLYYQLGASYLQAGADDKALDAFKKAIELYSGSGMLNTVAYALAEANKKLPEALQEAQQAVRELDEATGKIELDTLKVEDLGEMAATAAYWDTLGWVYFRLNDLNHAADYLEAAWALSLGGVEADHLAQAYEQQHKTAAAEHMYQMALAAGKAGMQTVPDVEATTTRLKKISGTATVSLNVDDFNKLRTFKLPRLVEGDANADFFFLLSAQEGKPGFKIEDVRFISGSEKLKSATKALKVINFGTKFPQGSPARLVRRGTLGCYQYTGCNVVLLQPDTVHSVN